MAEYLGRARHSCASPLRDDIFIGSQSSSHSARRSLDMSRWRRPRQSLHCQLYTLSQSEGAGSREQTQTNPDRRDFLKTAGAAAASALLVPRLEAAASLPGITESASAARAGLTVRPFALTQVKLGESLFTQKRDRMLAFGRGYGGEDV